MALEIPQSDRFKNFDDILSPDQRSTFFSRFDGASIREDTLQDHYSEIETFKLHEGVSPDVFIQFETAKNLYLYAWYVYRFYPVAEKLALTTLEFGLRSCLPSALPPGYGRKQQSNSTPTLAPLLKYAADQKLITNDGFQAWHTEVRERAKKRQLMESIILLESNEGHQNNSKCDNLSILPIDMEYDYVTHLIDILPKIRNSLAHGSSKLTNQIPQTFRNVTDILNQIYQNK